MTGKSPSPIITIMQRGDHHQPKGTTPMVTFTTIEQVLAHRFVGNHASDNEAFAAIDQFAANPATSIPDAMLALDHIANAGMGLEGKCDADAVLEHRKACHFK